MPVLVINPVEAFDVPRDREPLWYVEPYMDSVFRQVGDTLLKKRRAVREEVWPATAEHTVILGAGHGQASAYTAYRLERVYWVDMLGDGFSKTWLTGRKIFLLSCLAGRVLGKWLVERGAEQFLGWRAPYVFFVEFGERHRPGLPDYVFLKPVEEAMVVFAEKGGAEAYRHIREKYAEALQDPSLPERYRVALKSDRDSLVLYTRGAGLEAPLLQALAGASPLVAVLGTIVLNELF